MVQNNGNQVRERSVRAFPTSEEAPLSSLILSFASVADDFPPWGQNVRWRDQKLREFWPTEPVLAGAVGTVVARDSGFSWTLEGPPRTADAIQELLQGANNGEGWRSFITRWDTDLLTQDNGAFIEVIRASDNPTSPTIGIANLDAGRCRRTGIPETPVVYRDRKGVDHLLKWYQVIASSQFVSPIETMNGVQVSALSRVLRAAQLLRDISIYQREKVGGRNPAAIHLVSGIRGDEIADAVKEHENHQDEKGFIRYTLPVVLATLDPTATVSHEQIDLASLPDNFDLDITMRWYINQLALGFLADYQDFAPLPGRALGSGTQSLILHMKSQGKGPAVFMAILNHVFNFHGVIPKNVRFKFAEQDLEAAREQAEIRQMEAEAREVYVRSGVYTVEAVRQEMLDSGEISQELFDALQEGEDLTTDVVIQDTENLETKETERDWGDEEREELEANLEESIAAALNAARVLLERRIIGRKAWVLSWTEKDEATVPLLPDDEDLWAEIRTLLIVALSPYVGRVAGRAAQLNFELGLGVDLDFVNERMLEFTRTYINDWWTEVGETTRNALRQAILNWQESGLGRRGLPSLVEAIEPLFGPERARRIAVTEVTRLWDEGSRLAHESAGVTEEQWQTARDEGVCPICVPLDGKKYPINSGPRPVTDTHVNCLLPDNQIIARGLVGASRAYYSGPAMEIVTEAGYRLTVTPNHPILTPQGWVAANILRQGDDVISAVGQQGILTGNKDIDYAPPAIEEVFRSCNMVDRKLVESADFHGDGRYMDGDVDIVTANRQLRSIYQAPGGEPVQYDLLGGTDMAPAFLPRASSLALFSLRWNAPLGRSVRRLDLSRPLSGRHLLPFQQFRRTPISGVITSREEALLDCCPRYTEQNRQPMHRVSGLEGVTNISPGHGERSLSRTIKRWNAHRPEPVIENVVGDAVLLEQLFDWIPVPVASDKIVKIRYFSFSGHVYDLQTIPQLYIGSGIVVHNCRCQRLPVVRGIRFGG